MTNLSLIFTREKTIDEEIKNLDKKIIQKIVNVRNLKEHSNVIASFNCDQTDLMILNAHEESKILDEMNKQLDDVNKLQLEKRELKQKKIHRRYLLEKIGCFCF